MVAPGSPLPFYRWCIDDWGQRDGVKGRFDLAGGRLAIGCRALPGNSARRPDQRFHILRRHFLAVVGAGGTGNTFIHQGSAQIVDAGIQTCRRPFWPQLGPGSLDAVDQRVQCQARDRMHQHGFPEGRAGTGKTFQKNG